MCFHKEHTVYTLLSVVNIDVYFTGFFSLSSSFHSVAVPSFLFHVPLTSTNYFISFIFFPSCTKLPFGGSIGFVSKDVFLKSSCVRSTSAVGFCLLAACESCLLSTILIFHKASMKFNVKGACHVLNL